MILNQCMLDWLTLTSFAPAELYKVFEIHRAKGAERDVRRLQYSGKVTPDNLFFGTATQNRREHAMLQASGEIADYVFFHLPHEPDFRCTRIDLQLTIDRPTMFRSRELYDWLIDESLEWSGRRKNVSKVESGDALDTVYIGSRTSDLLIRIYIKPDKDGNPAYIRFEAEYKSDRANGVFESLLSRRHTMGSILSFELQRLPELPYSLRERFLEVTGDSAGAPAVKCVEGENSTIDWLLRQVAPAVIRLLHSHEQGDRMERILISWLRSADRWPPS